MSSTAEEKAALAFGVTAAADATGMTGILYRAAANATNQQITLPLNSTTGKAYVAGKWINVFSESVNVQIAFGVTAPTLVYNQASAAGTGHIAAGQSIVAGVVTPVLVPLNAKFLAVIANTSPTGNVEIYVSEGLSGGL